MTLHVEYIPGKGRGVVTSRRIREGGLVLTNPAIVFPNGHAKPKGIIHRYTFDWGRGRSALALGLGSLVNHAVRPNTRWDRWGLTEIKFVALRDIEADEEITINYHGWDGDDSPVGFRVV